MSTINPSLRLIMNLARMQTMMSRKFNGLSMHGISLSDYMVLYLLQQSSAEKMRRIDLAEKIGLTASGITRILLPMEKIGLIARESSQRDARVSYVVLTAAGRKIYKDATDTANRIAKEVAPPDVARNHSLTELYKQLGIASI